MPEFFHKSGLMGRKRISNIQQGMSNIQGKNTVVTPAFSGSIYVLE